MVDARTGVEFLGEKGYEIRQWYGSQSVARKVMYGILAVLGVASVIAFAIFNQVFLKFLVKLSDKWNQMAFGHLLLFLLVFFIGFPPLLGFSTLSIFCGMAYGIIEGWMLLASASISGSFVSFLVFRYALRERSEQLLTSNEKFRAFAEILKQDNSLLLLILIRLCPLPYSLSNGALAAIPELSPITYLLASILTCPKMFIHIFLGYQIKDIGNDKNSIKRRVFDGISVIMTAMASGLTTYIIYSKMQRKLQQFHNGYDENVIFGNFDDDTLELDSAEFDDDNFIIDDSHLDADSSPQEYTPKDVVSMDDFNVDVTEDSRRSYRDY